MSNSDIIPYGKQDVNQDDIDAVIQVLKSDFITQGPQIPAFENALKQYTGAGHAIAVSSGTAALHIACLALDVGKEDIVWTSPISFVASSNCALYCGAKVDFVDIDQNTYNMCATELENKLKTAKRENKLPKVVIPVHLSGQSCDMKQIAKLAKEYDFKIIEDASHAVGGKYENRPIGCCQYSDITVFSFHPVKIITTAEGGMTLTNSSELAAKMDLYRTHGITRDENRMTEKSHGPWYYQQIELGFNYRMTDIQAALGLNQLKRIDDFVKIRNELAERYNDLLKTLPVTIPTQIKESYSARHLYIICLNNPSSHQIVFKKMRELGIGVNLHYIPIHMQPYYKKLGFKEKTFTKAENYYKRAISLPLYSKLTYEQQDRVVNALKKALI